MTRRVTLSEARRACTPPLTQVELANLVSVDQTYISLLEAGKRSPSAELKNRLAEALGIAPSKLQFTVPQPAPSVTKRKDKPGHTAVRREKSAVA